MDKNEITVFEPIDKEEVNQKLKDKPKEAAAYLKLLTCGIYPTKITKGRKH